MSIRVLINGALGRMGQLAAETIKTHPALTLVGETGREHNLKEAIQDSNADVVVDFTHADVVFANCNLIIDAGARPVVGTSGLKKEQVKLLQEKCGPLKRGGLIAPNFSLGAVMMMKYAKEIAKYMSSVEIIEMHHDNKFDSPSGTAMRTAELLHEANQALNQPEKSTHENVPGARGATYQHIPIHSIRLPGMIAHQQVIFGCEGETLILQHDSRDRSCFMPGIALACQKVMGLTQLVYGLEEIL